MNPQTIKKSAALTLKAASHLLWPTLCLSCEKPAPSHKDLCQDCWNRLMSATSNDYCPKCGKDASIYAILDNGCPNCKNIDYSFDRIARAGTYQATLRSMILAYKLRDRTELNAILAMLLNSSLQSATFKKEIDFFVPVPLHWTRRIKRGYNQSYRLAKKLQHPAPINTELVRIRKTKYQSTLNTFRHKSKNVENAFAVRRSHSFAGSVICLIDDIKTTGATLNECAKTLKFAGAEKVHCLVLAVAPQ